VPRARDTEFEEIVVETMENELLGLDENGLAIFAQDFFHKEGQPG